MSGQDSGPRGARPGEWFRGLVGRLPGGSLAVGGMDRADLVVDQVPLLAWARTRLYEVETETVLVLRDRLERLEGALPLSMVAPMATTPIPTTVSVVSTNGGRSPAEAFAALLRTGETQSPAAAREAAVMRTIHELLPDEARILLTMSSGSVQAVLQAYDGDEQIICNKSNVGRNAKVRAQDLTTRYVTHLLELGLVELIPYQGREFYEWEMIEAETEVREVLGRYDHRKLIKPKLVRQILRLSPTGRAFCDVCIPS